MNGPVKGQDRYHIGQAYGGSQARRRRGKTIEWEWVHTGRAFARTHPLGTSRGGLWLVLAFVALHGMAAAYAGLHVSAVLYVFCLLDAVALMLLWRRHLAAWPLTWIVLVQSFPVSLPLMIYWADGTRPNLVYRHRFERLVRPQEPLPDVH